MVTRIVPVTSDELRLYSAARTVFITALGMDASSTLPSSLPGGAGDAEQRGQEQRYRWSNQKAYGRSQC